MSTTVPKRGRHREPSPRHRVHYESETRVGVEVDLLPLQKNPSLQENQIEKVVHLYYGERHKPLDPTDEQTIFSKFCKLASTL